MRGSFTSEKLRNDLQSVDRIIITPSVDIKEVQDAVKRCGSLLRQYKNTIANTGIHMHRSATQEIVQWLLTSDDKSLGVVLDIAGRGKTVLMREVLENLEYEDVEVLAIKADQQLAGITSPEELHFLASIRRQLLLSTRSMPFHFQWRRINTPSTSYLTLWPDCD